MRSRMRISNASGRRRFTALAVYTPDDCASFYPCAVCLQALSEFCGPDLEILCTAGGRTIRRTLGELLPESFGPEDLGIQRD